ncbi:putative MFS family arabinose efflux permease [Tumebacillus sp. BK434]|uniref:MFS transporter n=1 Tax=Tumebacillus sp. BK434 TaxID=2512169 RepID=UPI0010505B06|nr:MFS transporter [Tumebacillus sp. BK434]TCP52350.1 putative MFS family arabinose efflux permease [Tumebacillus sp. BK434]
MNSKLVRNNVWLIYAYTFATGLFFDRALWVLFLVERGMNMAQVGLLESLLHVAILLFEVPTGIVADLYGRRKSMLIGTFISLFYALFMMISGNFFTFTLAFALMGLSATFKTGASQALLYETLQAGGRESSYTKIMGNETALFLLSLSIAQWTGGLMAGVSWTVVYTSIIIAQLVAMALVFFVKEPERVHHSEEREQTGKKSTWQLWAGQFADTLSIWKKEPSLRKPVVLFVAVVTIITVVIFYAQEHFKRQGFTTGEIGFIFMAEALLSALAAKLAHRVESKIQFSKLFQGIYFGFLVLLLIFAVLKGWIAVLLLYAMGMLSTGLEPIFSNFVQAKLTAQVRATFFSMISLLTSFGIMLIFPLFGAVVDVIGFTYSFAGLAVLLVLMRMVIRRPAAV